MHNCMDAKPRNDRNALPARTSPIIKKISRPYALCDTCRVIAALRGDDWCPVLFRCNRESGAISAPAIQN